MTRKTRDTTDLAKASKMVKGLDERVSDIEEDARGEDDPVVVDRTLELNATVDVDDLYVRVYDADEVMTSDWDDLTYNEKYGETFAYDPIADQQLADDAVINENIFEWSLNHLEPSGDYSTIDLGVFGRGTPDDPGDELDDEVGTAAQAFTAVTASDNALFYWMLDYDDLNEDLTEFAIGSSGYRDFAVAPFQSTISNTSNQLVTVRAEIGWSDNGGSGGVITDGFSEYLAWQATSSNPNIEPPNEAIYGSSQSSNFPTDAEWVDEEIGRVPITQTTRFENEIHLNTYLDSTRMTNDELREFALPVHVIDFDTIITYSPINPTIQKSTLEQVSTTASIYFDH